ncbi:hypothetical protein K1719_001649 [Acacia pycnantha]|nr:hypothetical protein K1719_001649 [Acacia pycnantha]
MDSLCFFMCTKIKDFGIWVPLSRSRSLWTSGGPTLGAMWVDDSNSKSYFGMGNKPAKQETDDVILLKVVPPLDQAYMKWLARGVIFASNSFLELTEYTREEILGRNRRYDSYNNKELNKFSVVSKLVVKGLGWLLFQDEELREYVMFGTLRRNSEGL